MSWNRVLASDYRRGIFRGIYLFTMFQFLLLSFFFWLNARSMTNKPSLGDYLFYFFRGIPSVQNLQGGTFSLPTMWLQIFTCSLYVNLSYPLCDLMKEGEQILVRCRSRKTWYLSKCIWNVSASITYFLSAILAAMIVTFFTGGELILDFHPAFFRHLTSAHLKSSITYSEELLTLIVIPLTAIVAINIFQMTLSFIIKPAYAFLSCMTILVAGTFFPSPFLLGNGAMLLRSPILFVDGIQTAEVPSVIIDLLTIILCIPVGTIRFKRYDILPTARKE